MAKVEKALPSIVAREGKTDQEIALTHSVDSFNVPLNKIHFMVNRTERTFQVFGNSILLKEYPCVLGEKPDGDKMMQGDRKTPEGVFANRSKRMYDKWHAFVWIDYPNDVSRKRCADRIARGSIPATAKIGGEIGIDGVPEGMDDWIERGRDWIFGCIALRNADLDVIYPYINSATTTITIIP